MAKTVSAAPEKDESKDKDLPNTITPEGAQEFVNKMLALDEKRDNYDASVKSQMNDLYEKTANAFGISAKVLKLQMRHIRADRRRVKKENDLESSQAEDLKLLRDQLGDETPFGKYLSRKLAETVVQ